MNGSANSSDIYSIRDAAEPKPEKPRFTPPGTAAAGSVIGVTLSAGVSLCGAYRLDQKMYADDAGDYWLASDLKASRRVVVQILPLNIRQNTVALEPVRLAARQLEALDHPRIAPVHGSFYDPEHGFFIVRKHISGKTLDVFRKDTLKLRGKLAHSKAVKIVTDIASALDYAHRAGIFHGNLRPKNIFTGLDDEIYVANFSVLTNRKKDILFTNAYQSPEECDGGAASAPSDIYALSVIAYELLANRLPVLQDTAATPLPIQGVPGDVDAVLQRGMAKDPYDRYSTCLELVECLEQGLKSTSKVKISPVKPAESTPASPVIAAGVKKTDKRNTAGRYLLGGSILCLLIGGAVCGLFYQDLLQHPQKNGEIAGIGVKQEQEQEQPQPEPVQPAAAKTQEPAAPITEEPQEPVIKPAAPAEHTEPVNTGEQVTEEQPEPAVEPAIPAENTEPPVYEEPATEKGQESAAIIPANNEPLPPTKRDLAYYKREGGTLRISLTISEGSDPVEYVFRLCPPGWFTMGSPENEEGHQPDETPPHEITLAGFWILETEVTEEFWHIVMKDEPNSKPEWDVGPQSKFPMVNISWKDCEKFITKLNERKAAGKMEWKLSGKVQDEPEKWENLPEGDKEVAGYEFAFPTEQQWEYACRAGSTGAFGIADKAKANVRVKDIDGRKEVRFSPPNKWGLYDMHGNVKEWCKDYYAKGAYSEMKPKMSSNTIVDELRVVRGGSYKSKVEKCRSASRDYEGEQHSASDIGFRPVLVPKSTSGSHH